MFWTLDKNSKIYDSENIQVIFTTRLCEDLEKLRNHFNGRNLSVDTTDSLTYVGIKFSIPGIKNFCVIIIKIFIHWVQRFCFLISTK